MTPNISDMYLVKVLKLFFARYNIFSNDWLKVANITDINNYLQQNKNTGILAMIAKSCLDLGPRGDPQTVFGIVCSFCVPHINQKTIATIPLLQVSQKCIFRKGLVMN